MKRVWMGVIACLLMGVLPLACASKSVAESICEKGAECGKLKEGVTEKQCADNNSKLLAELRAVPECAEVADANEEGLQCTADLSCAELDAFLNDSTGSHKCNDPIKSVSLGSVMACNSAQKGM